MKDLLKIKSFAAILPLIFLFLHCVGEAPIVPETELFSGGAFTGPGTTQFTVQMVSPRNNDSSIPYNSDIIITFNEPTTAANVAAFLTVTGSDSGNITGLTAISPAGPANTFTLNPPDFDNTYSAFPVAPPGETITVQIAAGMPNAAATNTLDQTYTFTFSTIDQAVADVTPVVLANTQYPPKGATLVNVKQSYVEVTFSKAMNVGSLNGNFTLTRTLGAPHPTTGLPALFAGKTYRLPVTSTLLYNTSYTVTLNTAAVQDTLGNPLVANGEETWTFSTEANPNDPGATYSTDTLWVEDINFTTTTLYYSTNQFLANTKCYVQYKLNGAGGWTTWGTTDEFSNGIIHKFSVTGLAKSTRYQFRAWLDIDGSTTLNAGDYTSVTYDFTTKRLLTEAGGDQTGTVVLQSAGGGGYVFWLSGGDIYGQYFDVDGRPQWTTIPGGTLIVNGTAISDIKVVDDGATGAILVYNDGGNLYSTRVYNNAGAPAFNWSNTNLQTAILGGSTFSVCRRLTDYYTGYIAATGEVKSRSYTIGAGATTWNKYMGSVQTIKSLGYGQLTTVKSLGYGPVATVKSLGYGPSVNIKSAGRGPTVNIINTGGETTNSTGDYDNSLGTGTFHFIVTTPGPVNGTAVITYDFNGGAPTAAIPITSSPFTISDVGGSNINFTITDGVPAGLVLNNQWDVTVTTGLTESTWTSGDYSGADGIFHFVVTTGGGVGAAVVTWDFNGGATTGVPFSANPLAINNIGGTGLNFNISSVSDAVLNINDEWHVGAGTFYEESVTVSGDYSGADGTFHFIVTTGGGPGVAVITWDFNGGAGTPVTYTGSPFSINNVGGTGINFTITDGGDGVLNATDQWNVPVGTTYEESVTVSGDYTGANGTFHFIVTTGGGPGVAVITWDFNGGAGTPVTYTGSPFSINNVGGTGINFTITDGGDGVLHAGDQWNVPVGTGYEETAVEGGAYTGTLNGTYHFIVTTGGGPGVAVITWDFNGGAGTPVTYTGSPFSINNIGGNGVNFTITDGGDGVLNATDQWNIEVGTTIDVDVAGYTTVHIAPTGAGFGNFVAVYGSGTQIDASSWYIDESTVPMHTKKWTAPNIFGFAASKVYNVLQSKINLNAWYILADNTGDPGLTGIARISDAGAGGIEWSDTYIGNEPDMVIDQIGAAERVIIVNKNNTGQLLTYKAYDQAGAVALAQTNVMTLNDSYMSKVILGTNNAGATDAFTVTWFGEQTGQVGGNYFVRARQYNAAGVSLWLQTIYDTAADGGGNPFAMQSLYFNRGWATFGTMPLWLEYNATIDIYYNIIDYQGKLIED